MKSRALFSRQYSYCLQNLGITCIVRSFSPLHEMPDIFRHFMKCLTSRIACNIYTDILKNNNNKKPHTTPPPPKKKKKHNNNNNNNKTGKNPTSKTTTTKTTKTNKQQQFASCLKVVVFLPRLSSFFFGGVGVAIKLQCRFVAW